MLEYLYAMMNEARYRVRGFFKRVNYILLFMFYSVMVGFVSGLLLYIIVNRSGSDKVAFIDALFLGFSAYTCTGLNSVDFTKWSTVAIVVIAITVQFGSCVLLSAIPSFMRFRSYRKNRKRLLFFIDQAVTSRERSRHRKMLELVEERLTICIVLMVGCFLYWFLIQAVFLLLLCIEKPVSWSLFHVGSGFNNAGFGLSSSNMQPIAGNVYLLLVFSLMMPLGNTLFPVMFRLGMTVVYKWLRVVASSYDRPIFSRTPSEWCTAVKTLLVDPRSYFTHMFNRKDSLVLFLFWTTLTLTEFFMFIPEYSTDAFPATYSFPHKVVMGVFQTVTVRTTGFSVMNLSLVRIGHLAFWVLAMYVAAYPFILSEQISSSAYQDEGEGMKKYKDQAVTVIGRDLIWLYLAVVIIAWAETYYIATPIGNDLYLRVCFELASAFGTVGLSLGLPQTPTVSFSGNFASPLSKIVIILTMYCGKLRGLPPAIDKSIDIYVEDDEADEMDFPQSPLFSVVSNTFPPVSFTVNIDDERGGDEREKPQIQTCSVPLLSKEATDVE